MITYKYNLVGRFSPEDYPKIAKKAEAAAKGASAVDTGAYRRSWQVRLTGEFLFVSSSLRYAAPVELGSTVHKKHKHRIRNALARIGLGSGTVSLSAGVTAGFSSGKGVDITTTTSSDNQDTDTEDSTSAIPSISPLTPQEIRAPALLLNRFRTQRAVRPTVGNTSPSITKAQLFDRNFLLAALAAATLLREEEQVEEDTP